MKAIAGNTHRSPGQCPGGLLCLLVVALAVSASGCERRPIAGRIEPDPIDRTYVVDRDASGQARAQSFDGRYDSRLGAAVAGSVTPRSSAALPPGSKLHPSLVPLITGGDPDSVLHLIVSFRDSIPIPVFPRADTRQPRTSPMNIAASLQADSLIGVLRGLRAGGYEADSLQLAALPGVQVQGSFWLIQAKLVDAPVARLLAIDSLPNVADVRPVHGDESPPSVCPDGVEDVRCPVGEWKHNISSALTLIGMTGWRQSDYSSGWLGVLETGVFTDHVMLKDFFATPSQASLFQCEIACPPNCQSSTAATVNCTNCAAGNPGDKCQKGHGTATAGILVGHKDQFLDQEGMTNATLDWYSVYDQNCSGDCPDPNVSVTLPPATLNHCAAVRAFEMAIRRKVPVILAQVVSDASGTGLDPIDVAAAHAFETGSAVIAAAGNEPEGGLVAGPAREATVIGVGARYIDSWVEKTSNRSFQRFGPVGGRNKPEILAPTSTEAPSRCSDHAFAYFKNTSGAAPFAGGTASILNELVFRTTGWKEPGHTYAQLIVSGSLTGPFTEPSAGAGLLGVAPKTSKRWIGKTELMSGEIKTFDLPDATSDLVKVEAALWWPEPLVNGSRPHRQVKLELLDASGNPVTSSNDAANVFQRLSASRASLGPLSQWRFRFKWFTVCIPWGGVRCFSFPIPILVQQPWSIRISEMTTIPPGQVQTVYWTAVGRR